MVDAPKKQLIFAHPKGFKPTPDDEDGFLAMMPDLDEGPYWTIEEIEAQWQEAQRNSTKDRWQD